MLLEFLGNAEVFIGPSLVLTPFNLERRVKKKNASPARKSRPAADTPTPKPACATVLRLDADVTGARVVVTGIIVTGVVVVAEFVGVELLLGLEVAIDGEDVIANVVDAEIKSCWGANAWNVSLLGTLQSSLPEP